MNESAQIEEVSRDSRARVLRVTGRLDARSAQDLVMHCQTLLEQGHRHVVISMPGVSFVASSGIGSLLALTESFKDAGGSLRLAQLSHAVHSVVDLLNLGQFLAIDATEEDALVALGA